MQTLGVAGTVQYVESPAWPSHLPYNWIELLVRRFNGDPPQHLLTSLPLFLHHSNISFRMQYMDREDPDQKIFAHLRVQGIRLGISPDSGSLSIPGMKNMPITYDMWSPDDRFFLTHVLREGDGMLSICFWMTQDAKVLEERIQENLGNPRVLEQAALRGIYIAHFNTDLVVDSVRYTENERKYLDTALSARPDYVPLPAA